MDTYVVVASVEDRPANGNHPNLKTAKLILRPVEAENPEHAKKEAAKVLVADGIEVGRILYMGVLEKYNPEN